MATQEDRGSTSPPAKEERPAGAEAISIADAWHALSAITGHACGEEELFFDYGPEGGMRNFYCRMSQRVSWSTFLGWAPSFPFQGGPHSKSGLDLNHRTEFGRYDPAFVAWAAKALIPAASDERLREQTQGAYFTHARSLARTYWQVKRALDTRPDRAAQQQSAYLAKARAGEAMEGFWEFSALLDGSEAALDDHDPSHVRTATMWWMRRSSDGTAKAFRDALFSLLVAYDGDWVEVNQGPLGSRGPQDAKSGSADPAEVDEFEDINLDDEEALEQP